MPPIGLVLGKIDFSNLFINLTGQSYKSLAEAKTAGAPTVNYGVFFNTVLNFLIIAFVIFLFIRQVNRLKRQSEAAPATPTTKECPECLMAIPINAKRCGHCAVALK